jgi:RND family efflux transporter MFP subunit
MRLLVMFISLTAGGWLLMQGCSHSAGKPETLKINAERIPVRVLEVSRQEIAPVIHTSGLFTTDDETVLSFKTGGIIEKIFVKEGDAVVQGQLLAALNLTEINAQVAQANLALEKAKRDYQRAQNLYRDSVATLEQFQNAKTALEIADRQAEAARFNRTYSEIRAVANGFVLRKMANEGQVVGPGTPVLQTNGAGNNNWKLRAGVSDREWATISIGDNAVIKTDASPEEEMEAKVTRKSEGADPLNGTFAIELTIDKNNLSLASGMYGQAVIEASKKQSYWSIPYEALLDGNAQAGYVFTVTADNKAQKTPVQIQRIERNRVIISSGLHDNSSVIISGSAYLKDGSPVEIKN